MDNNTTAFSNGTLTRYQGRKSSTQGGFSELPTLLPLAILIALTNGFVFLLFATRKKLRTPSNYLLVSLAVSDFITGTVNIPIFIAFLNTHDSQLLLVFDPFSKLTAILTAYHILVVTAEKYIAIVKPLRHHSANPKILFITLGLVWLVSIVIAVVPSFWLSLMRKEYTKTKVHLQLGHDVFCFVFVFLLPYIFIVYAQIIMFRAISRSKGRSGLRRAVVTSTKRRNSRIRNERKCLAIFASMAILFAICWLPWFLLTFLATLTALIKELYPIMARPVTVSFLKTFAVVRFSTSIINPILYTFFKRDFMNACKSFCCCFSTNLPPRRVLSLQTSMTAKSPKQRLAKRRRFRKNGNEQLVNNSTTEEIIMHVTSL
jgi:hypothetical protein